MRPIHLHLRNFKSHPDTPLDLSTMRVASIVGTNGAGKSTILDAIVYALYGADGLGLARRADAVVREGEATASVTLEFDVAGERYRIERTRTITGAGKSTVEFARRLAPDLHNDTNDGWSSLTAGTAKDTQRAIEDVVGATAETFRQAVYIGQEDAARFADATPGERKDTLAQALDLQQYPPLADEARTKVRGLEGLVANTDQLIERLEGVLAGSIKPEQVDIARDLVDRWKTDAATADAALSAHRGTLATLREGAAAGEAARQKADNLERELATARTDAAGMVRLRDEAERAVAEAKAARTRVDTLTDETQPLVDLEPLEAKVTAARDARQAVVDQRADLSKREQAHADAKRAVTAHANTVQRLADERDAAMAKRAELDQSKPCCPTCEQTVEGEAYTRAVATLDAAVKVASDAVEQAKTQQAELDARLEAAPEVPASEDTRLAEALAAASEELQTAEGVLGAARKLNERHHAAQRDIAAASAVADRLPDLEQTLEARQIAVRDLEQRVADLEPRAAEARAAVVDDGHADRLKAAQEAVEAAEREVKRCADGRAEAERIVAKGEAALEAAQGTRDELAAARAKRDQVQADLDRWQTLTRAFGRDGIPAQVIRHAAPQIEADANGLLAEWGVAFRVRLDLERETKAGTVADALDITVLIDGRERDIANLSGGERYRVNVALRVAIARVLAHRAGRRIETLVLDEPEGLDATGFSALADIIGSLGAEFPLVLTVSHTDGLEAACDTMLRVQRDENGSRVEVVA